MHPPIQAFKDSAPGGGTSREEDSDERMHAGAVTQLDVDLPGAAAPAVAIWRMSSDVSDPAYPHPAPSGGDAPRVLPGQVWRDDTRRPDTLLRVICVDSAYAYCRGGRDGEGRGCRIPLHRFDHRHGGGLDILADADGPEDLVQRRVLTALWELDYSGAPRTLALIEQMLGSFYPRDEVERSLASAEAAGLVRRTQDQEPQWGLTGGGRRLAAVG